MNSYHTKIDRYIDGKYLTTHKDNYSGGWRYQIFNLNPTVLAEESDELFQTPDEAFIAGEDSIIKRK